MKMSFLRRKIQDVFKGFSLGFSSLMQILNDWKMVLIIYAYVAK